MVLNEKNTKCKKEGNGIGKKINVSLSSPSKGKWMKVVRTLSTVTCSKCDFCSLYAKGQCLNVGKTEQDADLCKYGHVFSTTFEHLSASRSHALKKVCEKDPAYNVLCHPGNWFMEFVDDMLLLDLKFAVCDKQAYVSGNLVESKDYHVRVSESVLCSYSVIPIDKMTIELLNEIVTFGKILSDAVAKEYDNVVVPEILHGIKKILPNIYKEYAEKFVSIS